jgi:hypothetical protein
MASMPLALDSSVRFRSNGYRDPASMPSMMCACCSGPIAVTLGRGDTPSITVAATPHSEAGHPPAAYPSCEDAQLVTVLAGTRVA